MNFILDILLLLIIRTLILILYLLPRNQAIFFAKLIIRIILIFLPRARKVGMRNLQLIFPEKSTKELRGILSFSFDILAENLLAYAKSPRLNKKMLSEMIDYSEVLKLTSEVRNRQSREGEQGVNMGFLLPTLHYGCFELLVHFQTILDRPFSFLARGFGLPNLDNYWNKRREMFGAEVFARKGGYQEIIKRIKSGRDVGILMDQNVKFNHAIFVDFFGIKAATTKTIGIVALRTSCPIIFGVTAYLGNNKHKAYLFEIKNPVDEPGSIEEKIEKITKQIHIHAEEVIRKHPEQWFWIHRRYKTRPNGEPENIY